MVPKELSSAMEWLNKCIVMIVFLNVGVGCQIAFPENNVDPTIQNRDNRQPIYAPSQCGENELFYPGDQANDWICDCRPAYVYHPLSNKCYRAYRRGPCQEREYLVIRAGSIIPGCVANPCLRDGFVPWGSVCAQLDTTEACTEAGGTGYAHARDHVGRVLAVNVTTLSLECQPVVLSTRLGDDEAPRSSPRCPPGGRRSVSQTCTIER